jgi:hypothetical protein
MEVAVGCYYHTRVTVAVTGQLLAPAANRKAVDNWHDPLVYPNQKNGQNAEPVGTWALGNTDDNGITLDNLDFKYAVTVKTLPNDANGNDVSCNNGDGTTNPDCYKTEKLSQLGFTFETDEPGCPATDINLYSDPDC